MYEQNVCGNNYSFNEKKEDKSKMEYEIYVRPKIKEM